MSDPILARDKVADWLASGGAPGSSESAHHYLHTTFDARFIVKACTPFKTIATGEGATLSGAMSHLATKL